MFSKYYLEELAYLRDMGREYARRHPETGGMLSESGADPDVERLLEGFAFLTARIREKLDDELPELTHSLLELFWPHYLRPFPAMTVVQFQPTSKAFAKAPKIPRGTQVASKPIDGTSCVFQTCFDTQLVPLKIQEVEVGPGASPYIRLRIAPRVPASFGKLNLDQLRLHFPGDTHASRGLRLCLLRYFKGLKVRPVGGEPVAVPGVTSHEVGFADSEALLPLPSRSFSGFRLLQEYLCYPKKFLFAEFRGLGGLRQVGTAPAFDLFFELEALPHDMPPIGPGDVALNCTPAVNLFKHDGDPIDVDHRRSRYPVNPGGQPGHFEVFSVENVKGVVQGRGDTRDYAHFFAFDRKPDELYYKTQRVESATESGTALYMTFPGQVGSPQLGAEAGSAPTLVDRETISLELVCTNRQLPRSLGAGEVCIPGENTPAFATFKNLDPPTPAVPPPLRGDVFWGLLGHLSLNHLSLTQPDRFRELLGLYHFRAQVDRQAAVSLRRRQDGILDLRAKPETRVLGASVVRGMKVEIKVDEEAFGSQGETHLFGSILDSFFAQYVSLNAYSRVVLTGEKFGEVHTWPPRSGCRTIL